MRVDRNGLLSWTVAILALGFHALGGLMAALMGVFPTTLDELQHLSYIRSMEQARRLFPRYEDLRVLDAGGAHFTHAVNYLNHPSPYYLFMGLVDRAVGGSILGLRLADLGLSLCAVALMLVAGFRVVTGWKERAVFAAALVLFPKLGVVAGLINNDNAALLATAVSFLGLIEWSRRPSLKTALLLALGVALCGWTKLTVLLMIGFSLLFGEAFRLAVEKTRAPLAAYAIVAAGFAVAALPSLMNMLAYGRILHHTNAFYVAPALRASLSFAGYAQVFFYNMADKWAALEPSHLIQMIGLYVVLAFAAAALVFAPRKMADPRTGPGWRVACAMILAVVPVLILHLYFGWRTFVEDGFIDMAQTRYYYGVWPGVALGLALMWSSALRPPLRAPVAILTGSLLVSSSIAALGLILLIHGQTTIG